MVEFIWDSGNLKHILDDHPERENIKSEVESIFDDVNFMYEKDRINKYGDQEYFGIGVGNEKKLKYVVFEIRNDKIRPITFRRASKKETNKYYERG